MAQRTSLPWEKMHDFLLDSGSVRDPRDLCVALVKKIYTLIPYDQARIYFVDDNGKVYDEVLFGVDKHWSRAYLEYYCQVENGRYGMRGESLPCRYRYDGNIHDWDTHAPNEFITDYIKPQGLRCSMGFALHDADHSRKCLYMLDRTTGRRYTAEEIGIISVVQPQLDNLHRNLFVSPPATSACQNPLWEEAPLTRRESEITRLLCDGVTPANIGRKLSLSVATVYRHTANIYSKLQVSSQQELLVKMLRQPNHSAI